MNNNLSALRNGALILSFDDQNFKGWEEARPLFRQHKAHATFFISEVIDAVAIEAMKHLAEDGHSIGLHGLTHGNADQMFEQMSPEEYFDSEIRPQLDECTRAGITVTSFAYPNCRRTEATDALFFAHGFRAVRGAVGLTHYDPKHLHAAEWTPLAENPRALFPVADLPQTRLINCLLVGDAYNTHIDDIINCLRRAAEKNEVLVLTSHNIAAEPGDIGMRTEWLEAILQTCSTLGIAALGFDEI